MRRFAKKGWYDIDVPRCKQLIQDTDRSLTPRIGNHHAVLHRLSNNVLRIQPKSFSGVGTMGRLAGSGGATCQITVLESKDRAHIPPGIEDAVTLNSLPPKRLRSPLNLVMGSSAAVKSGIENAEYLHIIAHRLGGGDVFENLVIGLHALNTAMIPFENLAADLAARGVALRYGVQMLPLPGLVFCAGSAVINLNVTKNSAMWHRILRLDIKENRTSFLSKESYRLANTYTDTFKQQIEEFLRSAGQSSQEGYC